MKSGDTVLVLTHSPPRQGTILYRCGGDPNFWVVAVGEETLKVRKKKLKIVKEEPNGTQ